MFRDGALTFKNFGVVILKMTFFVERGVSLFLFILFVQILYRSKIKTVEGSCLQESNWILYGRCRGDTFKIEVLSIFFRSFLPLSAYTMKLLPSLYNNT